MFYGIWGNEILYLSQQMTLVVLSLVEFFYCLSEDKICSCVLRCPSDWLDPKQATDVKHQASSFSRSFVSNKFCLMIRQPLLSLSRSFRTLVMNVYKTLGTVTTHELVGLGVRSSVILASHIDGFVTWVVSSEVVVLVVSWKNCSQQQEHCTIQYTYLVFLYARRVINLRYS